MDFSICLTATAINEALINTVKSLSKLDYPKENIKASLFINGPHTESELLEIGSFLDWNQIIATDESLGPSRAKNVALDMARTKWAVLLDGDDFLLPSALSQYEKIISQNPNLMVGCEYSIINKIDGNMFHPSKKEEYWAFLLAQKERALTTAACGRPILFNTKHLIPFDCQFSFGEERKLMIDYWKAGYVTHIMTTASYLYVIEMAKVKNDPQQLKTISDLCKSTNPKIEIADFNPLISKLDLEFMRYL